MSIQGLRQTARWTSGTGRKAVGAVLLAATLVAHSALSWAWTQAGAELLGTPQRAALLAGVAAAVAVFLLVFRPWVELTPAGTLVVQNPLRRHHIGLDQVAHAHRDAAGLHLRLTDGRYLVALALHDAVAVADAARRDPRLSRALGYGLSRDTFAYLAAHERATTPVDARAAEGGAARIEYDDRAIA